MDYAEGSRRRKEMSTRKLNIPSLGFEVVVVGASAKTNELIAGMLEKKIVTEDAQPVWGKEDGYCAWCVDMLLIGEPIWEYSTDSQGDSVKYACCTQCAADRGVDHEPQGCKHCGNVANGCTC